MSTTAKIDFDPALFGDGTPESVGMPSIRLKSKPRRWPFVFLAFVVGIAAIGIVITKMNAPPAAKNSDHQFAVVSKTFMSEPGRAQIQNVPPLQAYSANSNGWCDGDETICTTITTGKPTETLQKLIAAIPLGKAKQQYKVRLSVTPVE